jgi:hypothetical protein
MVSERCDDSSLLPAAPDKGGLLERLDLSASNTAFLPPDTSGSSHRSTEHLELNEISGRLVDAAINVHMRLEPGVLEERYEREITRMRPVYGIAK